jgi:hypothetical protein
LGRDAEPDQCIDIPGHDEALVRAYADQIVLLNPAVEGARYEPLHAAIEDRSGNPPGSPGAFCRNQKPVMISLTSANDWATGKIFWVVRAAATIFESVHPLNPNDKDMQPYIAFEEGRSSTRAMGHNPRYWTHELGGAELLQEQARQEPDNAPLQQYARYIADLCHGQPTSRIEQMLSEASCTRAPERAKPAFEVAAGGDKAQTEQEARPNIGVERCVQPHLADLRLARSLARQANAHGQVPAGWSASCLGGTVLRHLPVYDPEPERFGHLKIPRDHAPYAPVWNIYVRDRSIMDGHGDIKYRSLIEFLKQVYRSAILKNYSPGQLDDLQALAVHEIGLCMQQAQAAPQ